MKRLKKKHIVIILCAVIALLGLLFAANKIYREYQARHENDDKTLFDGAVVIKHYHNTDYYISEKSYDGEHDIQTFWQEDLTGLDCTTVMNYTEYHQYCKRWELTEKYHDPDLNYIVLSRSRYCGNCAHAVLSGVEYNGSDATLYLWYDLYGNTDGNSFGGMQPLWQMVLDHTVLQGGFIDCVSWSELAQKPYLPELKQLYRPFDEGQNHRYKD